MGRETWRGIRNTEVKQRDVKALFEGGKAKGSIYTPGSTVGTGAHPICLYTHTIWGTNGTNEKLWSFPRVMMSLELVRFGGLSPTAGVLGCRAICCSGGVGREGGVEVLHST